ncbi:MAG: ribosome biogenesis GTPase YlqF, partial [Synechococcaceae bacterium WB7_3xG_012]|nr:ribosome biogenesis GTPase YlqF [Synechococcaceae bacterium WB7_3xG_012]
MPRDGGAVSELLSSAAPSIQWYPGHIAKAERAL